MSRWYAMSTKMFGQLMLVFLNICQATPDVSNCGHDDCAVGLDALDQERAWAVQLLQQELLVSKAIAAQRSRSREENGVLPSSEPMTSLNAPYRELLNNYEDMQYSATITVGGQAMEGILDTGSFELLVFADKCKTCGTSKLFYNSSESTTYEKHPENITTMHSFGSGDTWSTLAFERVTFGDLTIDKQYFWEVERADLPVLVYHNSFQAIVGVGPTATMKKENRIVAGEAAAIETGLDWVGVSAPQSITDKKEAALILAEQKPVLENLGTNIFSVCFLRGEGQPGYFIWNDADPKNSPHMFRELPIIGNAHWEVSLKDVQFTGGDDQTDMGLACQDNTGCTAVVDSGTSLIAVPTETAKLAFSKLNSLDHVDCENVSSFPTLELTLGGHKISLPPEAYITEVEGELPAGPFGWIPLGIKMCTLGFITMDIVTPTGPLWIIGMPFFREYYTTFHMGENAWDRSNRSLFIAKADEQCHPNPDASASLLQRPKKPRRVNLSKVSWSPWLTKMWKFAKGTGVAAFAKSADVAQ